MQHSAPQCLRIATRESRLARWQAEHVQARLQALYPACEVSLVPMSTRGDQILDRPLAAIGGKGLFIKELEVALLEDRADLAVHSIKDVPMLLEPEFALPCILERGEYRDALVSTRYASFAEMPPGAVIGTSSQRREAQIHAQYPYLSVSGLRGNLDTRLRKLDEGQYDGIILAATGLQRLGLQDRIRLVLPPEISLPAAGQGALGVECLHARDDVKRCLEPLHCPASAQAVWTERAVARALGGSCQTPLAAFALRLQDDSGLLWVRAMVALIDGSVVLHAQARGSVRTEQDAEVLAAQVVADLRTQGADDVLAASAN